MLSERFSRVPNFGSDPRGRVWDESLSRDCDRAAVAIVSTASLLATTKQNRSNARQAYGAFVDLASRETHLARARRVLGGSTASLSPGPESARLQGLSEPSEGHGKGMESSATDPNKGAMGPSVPAQPRTSRQPRQQPTPPGALTARRDLARLDITTLDVVIRTSNACTVMRTRGRRCRHDQSFRPALHGLCLPAV